MIDRNRDYQTPSSSESRPEEEIQEAMDTTKAIENLDGLILGDAGLERFTGGARFSMGLSKPSISMEAHLRWLQWIADSVFAVLGIPVCAGHPKVFSSISKGNLYRYARLTTRTHLILGELHDEWYSGGEWVRNKQGAWHVRKAIKVLPARLMTTNKLPLPTLAQWWLCDGGLGRDYRNPRNLSHWFSFSTYCFMEKEVQHLTFLLNNLGISTSKPHKEMCKVGAGLRINLSATPDNNDRLIDLIEPFIVEIFGDDDLEGFSYKDRMERVWRKAPRT